MQADPATIIASRAGHSCVGGVHTHTADGRLLCWRTTGLTRLLRAVDAEVCHQPVPPALARRAPNLSADQFWVRWTRAEVRAKLHDVPIITWITTVSWQTDGDLDPPADLVTVRDSDLVVSYGLLQRPSRPT